jgi:protein O-mannosyl-transferase
MRPVLFLGCLLIVLAVGFVYYSAFPGTFIGEDITEIRGDYRLASLANIADVAFRGNAQLAWPVGSISFIVNRAITGDLAQGFLAINVAVHVLNSFLVVFLMAAVLAAISGSNASDHSRLGENIWLDFFAISCGLVWALHPLNTQTVATIFQRHELLMTIFFLLAVLQCVRYLLAPHAGRLIAMALFAALAGFSKTSAVALPLIPLLLGFPLGTNRRSVLTSSMAMLAAPAAVLLTLGLQWSEFRASAASGGGMWTNLLTQANVVHHYLFTSLFPSRQSVVYDWPTFETLGAVMPHVAGIVILLVVGVMMLWLRSLVGVGILWLFVTLIPNSILFPMAPVATETRMYLPLIGLVFFVAGIVVMLGRLFTRTPTVDQADSTGLKPPANAIIAVSALGLLVAAVLLGTLARKRAEVLRTTESRWQDALASGFAPVTANLELASIAMDSRKYAQAEQFSLAALQADRSKTSAWTILANSMSRRGGNVQAIQMLTEALANGDLQDDGRVSLSLGNASVNGDVPAAIAHFEKAVELSPQMSEAWNNLGILLAREPSTYDRAQDCYNRALFAKRDNLQTYLNLSTLQIKSGKFLEARATLMAAESILGSQPELVQRRTTLEKVIRDNLKTTK